MTYLHTNSADTDELYEHHRILVDPGQSPLRIDRFLLDRLEKVSRNRIQQAIKAGNILVDDKTIKPNFKVKPRQLITIVLPSPPQEDFELKGENIPLNIIYEDQDIIIVNKEAGMVVHPGIKNYSGTLVNALVYYLNDKQLPVLDGNNMDRPGLVHRIDKGTSGLLIIAKNEKSLSHLAKQFYDHSIERNYTALIWGSPKDKEGTIDKYIGRHPKDRLRMFVFEEKESGKHAVTHYKVLEDLYYVSLINCQLETGRTHQIRVHMSYLGHPIFSDTRYGGSQIVKGTIFTKYKQFINNCFKIMPRQSLHASSLGFIHPGTGKKMNFESPLPDDFQNVLEKWRKYLHTRKKKF